MCSILAAIILAYCLGFGCGLAYQSQTPGLVSAAPETIDLFQQVETRHAAGFHADETLDEQFRVFWEAWDLVDDDFYGDLPAQRERIYGAIKGMVASLGDEHTLFLTPQEAAILSSADSGRFVGIGATVQIDEQIGYPRITQLFAGQPASRAGLLAGDVILAIDDVSTHAMSILDVVSLIRGPKNSMVQLTIQRQGDGAPESSVVPVMRQEIEIPVVETEMFEGGVAYLRLAEFNSVASKRLTAGLESLLERKPKGLILDLRGNPGGYLHVAVDVASQFVPSGKIVTEKSRDGSENTFEVKPGGLATSPALPLAVLIDAGSASATEIVAAAIRDSGRGILIGETSFGKSSVQMPHELSDGSELRVTVARWFAPNGYALEDGLSPEIAVTATVEDLEAHRDPQKDWAVEYLMESH